MSCTTHGYANSHAYDLHQIAKRGLSGYQVKKLRVEIKPPEATSLGQITAVTLTGTAGTYYIKSLASQALINHCHSHGITLFNDINVAAGEK